MIMYVANLFLSWLLLHRICELKILFVVFKSGSIGGGRKIMLIFFNTKETYFLDRIRHFETHTFNQFGPI